MLRQFAARWVRACGDDAPEDRDHRGLAAGLALAQAVDGARAAAGVAAQFQEATMYVPHVMQVIEVARAVGVAPVVLEWMHVTLVALSVLAAVVRIVRRRRRRDVARRPRQRSV
jgi:hypothetical protein